MSPPDQLIGYSGLGVFSKAFSRWAGQRPNAFRRQMRELDASKASQDLPSQKFLDRALSGSLADEEVVWLLERLRCLYPAARGDGEVASPSEPGLASGLGT